jgi:hypothetical protein
MAEEERLRLFQSLELYGPSSILEFSELSCKIRNPVDETPRVSLHRFYLSSTSIKNGNVVLILVWPGSICLNDNTPSWIAKSEGWVS